MNWFDFVLLGLATWRVSSLLVHEDGPFLVFRKLRKKVGIQHDENGNIFMIPDGLLPGIFSCVWCASVWLAGGWMIAWVLIPKITVLVAAFFGISAVAILMEGKKK